MKGEIKILNEEVGGCPMIWNVTLPDGSEGYIRYRWGIISLKPVTEHAGLFTDPIIFEQIGGEYDGVLSLDAAILWLRGKGYTVVVDESLPCNISNPVPSPTPPAK